MGVSHLRFITLHYSGSGFLPDLPSGRQVRYNSSPDYHRDSGSLPIDMVWFTAILNADSITIP